MNDSQSNGKSLKEELEIKRQQVDETKEEEVTITDEKGKEHKAKVKSYTEAEMEDLHLIKIAPMYYFSEESRKVIMIPFSLKMSVEEFLRQTAAQAVNFEKVIDEINQRVTERKKQKEGGE